MAEATQPSKGRFRQWLDRRRDSRRRGAEMAHRAKAARKADHDKAMRHGNVGSGDPGPFGGM
jgi:hypothetical protein